MTELGNCPLCGRKLVAGGSVNQHHLVPRSRNGRETIALHRICLLIPVMSLGHSEIMSLAVPR